MASTPSIVDHCPSSPPAPPPLHPRNTVGLRPIPNRVPKPIACPADFIETLLKFRFDADPARTSSERYIPLAFGNSHAWFDTETREFWKPVDLFQLVKNAAPGVPTLEAWFPIQLQYTERVLHAGYVDAELFNQMLEQRPQPVMCGTRSYKLFKLHRDGNTALLELRYLRESGGSIVSAPKDETIVYESPGWVVKGTGERFRLGFQHQPVLSCRRQKVQTAQGQGIVDLKVSRHSKYYDEASLATLHMVTVLYKDGSKVLTDVNEIQKASDNVLVGALQDFDEWYRWDKAAVRSQDISLKLLREYFNSKKKFLIDEEKVTSENSDADDSDYYYDSDCDGSSIKTRFPPKHFVIQIDKYDNERVKFLGIAGYRIIWLLDTSIQEDCIPQSFKVYKGRMGTERGGGTAEREVDSNDGDWDKVSLRDGEAET